MEHCRIYILSSYVDTTVLNTIIDMVKPRLTFDSSGSNNRLLTRTCTVRIQTSVYSREWKWHLST